MESNAGKNAAKIKGGGRGRAKKGAKAAPQVDNQIKEIELDLDDGEVAVEISGAATSGIVASQVAITAG